MQGIHTPSLSYNTLHSFNEQYQWEHMKSSDAKASKCHLKFSSWMMIFIKRVYLSSVISLKWQLIGNHHCHLSEITELKYTSLIKIIILKENFKWHLEAFASELFIYIYKYIYRLYNYNGMAKKFLLLIIIITHRLEPF